MAFKLATAFVEIVAKNDKLQAGLVQTKALFNKSFLGGLAGGAAGAALGSVVGLADQLIDKMIRLGSGVTFLKLADDIKRTELQFNVLIRDMEKTRALLTDIGKIRALEVTKEDVQEAAMRLLRMGIEVKNVSSILKTLGDVAAGSGANLDDLISLLLRVRSEGHLTRGTERAFINQGVALHLLGKNAKLTAEEWKRMVEEGRVSFETIAKLLEDATKQGGRFHGAMSSQSRTLGQLWGDLADNFKTMGASIGRVLSPVVDVILQGLIKQTHELADAFKAIPDAIDDISNAFVRMEQKGRKSFDTLLERANQTLKLSRQLGPAGAGLPGVALETALQRAIDRIFGLKPREKLKGAEQPRTLGQMLGKGAGAKLDIEPGFFAFDQISRQIQEALLKQADPQKETNQLLEMGNLVRSRQEILLAQISQKLDNRLAIASSI